MDRLDALRLFVRVVETGSFTRVADEAGVGQPAVSKQIAQLEARFKLRLLARTSRSLRPTDEGVALYERARGLLAAFDETESDLASAARKAAGRLRVACPMAFGRLYIAPLVAEFLKSHPDSSIDLVMNDRYIDLVEEGIDVAIRIGNLDDAQLAGKLLGASTRTLVAAPAYLAKRSAPKSPRDLADHNVLVYSYIEAPETLTLIHAKGEETVSVRGNLRVNNAEALRDAAVRGLGIAALPIWAVAKELERGRLAQVMPSWKPSGSQIYAVYRSNRYLPTRVRLFIDYLADNVRVPVG